MSLISSKIDIYHSMAAAGLASVTYYREQNKESFSIVARNFGYQFRAYNGFRENLPFRIDAGYTKNFGYLSDDGQYNSSRFTEV